MRVATAKRRLPSQHFIDHAAERVDVASPVEVAVRRDLFRTHVCRSADCYPGARKAFTRGSDDCARDAEVEHVHILAAEQDVLRLDVAVDDAVLVRKAHRLDDLLCNAHSLFHRELRLTIQSLPQRLTVDKRHRVEGQVADHSRLDHVRDARVIEVRGEFDLAEEALLGDYARELWPKDFYRRVLTAARIRAQVDCRHPTVTELPLDTVVVAEHAMSVSDRVDAHPEGLVTLRTRGLMQRGRLTPQSENEP